MLQHFGHGQRSHRAALMIAYFDAGVVRGDAVLHVLPHHVPRAGLGLVQRIFQMGIVRASWSRTIPFLVVKVDEEPGHLSVLYERP